MSTPTDVKPRDLKPELLELDGISRATVEAHYRLYQGYVAKRNEILAKLAALDPAGANQVYSELRALKVDLSFAIGGIKNHEVYFGHLGGSAATPGAIGELIKRDFGSIGPGATTSRRPGWPPWWAWTAYDWDEGRLFNYLGDAQNTSRSGTRRRSSRSTPTSTRTSSTSRPTAQPTSRRSSRTSTGAS